MSRQYDFEYPETPLISAPKPHNCKRFVGKTVVLTASTLGMGLSMATRFAEEGANVVVSSRKQKQVDETVASLRQQGYEAAGCTCHQGKAEDRRALIQLALEKYGPIDAVVLCTGIQPAPANGPTLDVPSEMFDKIFDVNVKSFWEFVKQVKPHLAPRAAFCFISSNGGYNPAPPLGLYGVSKTALFGLTKLLATELGPEGIRVNCLAPGLVRTRFSEFLWKDDGSGSGRAMKAVESGAFLRRAADPYEMAGAVAYMCSDDSSYMTGETMLLDGGGSARL